MKVLVLNAGSSSQKSCLYELSGPLTDLPPEPLWQAHIDWTHQAGVVEIHVQSQTGSLQKQLPSGSRLQVMGHMLETLWSGETQVVSHPLEIEAVGHRVVHGGEQYRESTRITSEVKAEIERLSAFAPLHNPASLEGIEAIEQVLPNVPQVAVFDTAFHSQLPLAAAVYPGPYEWFTEGIRRYGFHGISHAYCAQRTAAILGRDLGSLRLIICHLGNGCSL
ncbi:MAG: acetate kinase, partial [Gemmatimonadaceae bacterium]|nr:acetate kinase [Gloeobacterales cyanobacterium ES-bin-141]